MTTHDTPPARHGRRLAALAWMIALYVATAVTATTNLLPMAPPLLEARNIAIHSTGYAVQAVLVVRAASAPGHPLKRRDRWVVLALVLVLGIGQEVLQTILRARAYPLNSLLDLAVDVSGAALGLWLLHRRARRAMRRTDAAGSPASRHP